MPCMYRITLRVNTSSDEEPKEPCIQDWVLVGRMSLQGSFAAQYTKGGLSLLSHSSNEDDPTLNCCSASVRPSSGPRFGILAQDKDRGSGYNLLQGHDNGWSHSRVYRREGGGFWTGSAWELVGEADEDKVRDGDSYSHEGAAVGTMRQAPESLWNVHPQTCSNLSGTRSKVLVHLHGSILLLLQKEKGSTAVRFPANWYTALHNTHSATVHIVLAGPCPAGRLQPPRNMLA